MKSNNKYKDKINIIYNEKTGHREGFIYETKNVKERGYFDKSNRIDFLLKKNKRTRGTIGKTFFYYKDFEIAPTSNIFGNILESSMKYNFAIELDEHKNRKLFFNISNIKLKQIKKINYGRKENK